MKLSLLNHITCPRCQSKLYLGRSINRHDEVFHGTLQCQDEGHVFAIDNGVPDFLSPETSVSQLKVADTYSKKWRMMPDYGYSEAHTSVPERLVPAKIRLENDRKFPKILEQETESA